MVYPALARRRAHEKAGVDPLLLVDLDAERGVVTLASQVVSITSQGSIHGVVLDTTDGTFPDQVAGGGPNGADYFAFDGSDCIHTASTIAGLPASNNERTLILVWRVASPTSVGGLFYSPDVFGTSGTLLSVNNNGGQGRWRAFCNPGNRQSAFGTSMYGIGWHVATFTLTPTTPGNGTYRLFNNQAELSLSAPSETTANTGASNIVGFRDASTPGNWDVARAQIWGNVVDDATRTARIQAMMDEYAIV